MHFRFSVCEADLPTSPTKDCDWQQKEIHIHGPVQSIYCVVQTHSALLSAAAFL